MSSSSTPSPAAIWCTTLPQAMREDARLEQHRDLVHRPAEAHDVEEIIRLVVRGVVEHSKQRTWSIRSLMLVSDSGSQSLAKPGSMPFTYSETPPSAAASLHALGHVDGHAGRVLEEDRAARDHVDAGAQESLEVSHRLEQPVVGHRGVQHAVGLERDDLRASFGGEHAEVAVEPGELGRHPCPPCRGWTPRRRPGRGPVGRRCPPGRASRRCRCSTATTLMLIAASPRSGSAMSRLGWSMPPSTSMTLPVT